MFSNKFPDKLTLNNPFVVIKNKWDLNAHQSDQDHKNEFQQQLKTGSR